MCIVHACMYIANSGDGLCIYHGYANERQRCELHMSKKGERKMLVNQTRVSDLQIFSRPFGS